jgi:hypothetical protein
MNLAIGYALFKFGMPSYSILVAAIFVNSMAGMLRLGFMKRLSEMRLRTWCFDVFARTIAWLSIPVLAGSFMIMTQPQGWLRFLIVTSTYFVLAGLGFCFFGIGRDERSQIKEQSLAIWGKLTPCMRTR